jgi:hypothetical protein
MHYARAERASTRVSATHFEKLGFFPCAADPDVWIRDAGDVYEYVCMYVDGIIGGLKDPVAFMKALRGPPFEYVFKGGEEPTYHLGGDFYRDDDGTLCWGAKTYIKRMVDNYEMLFGERPTGSNAPISKDDHPELDISPFLEDDDIQKYQSLIGALQ